MTVNTHVDTTSATVLTIEISSLESAIVATMPTAHPVAKNSLCDSFNPTRPLNFSMRTGANSYASVCKPLEAIWDGSVAKSHQFITELCLLEKKVKWDTSPHQGINNIDSKTIKPDGQTIPCNLLTDCNL